MRLALPALVLSVLAVLTACPSERARNGASAEGDAAARDALAWLDPAARISSAVRLTGPPNVDIRQAQYWAPLNASGAESELAVLLRTRDYSTRTPGQPDAQRVAVLNLRTGRTEVFDEGSGRGTVRLAVSPNHRFAVIATLPQAEGSEDYTTTGLILRGHGYGDTVAEVVPRPPVLPLRVQADGGVQCALTRTITLDAGLPRVQLDHGGGLQLASMTAKSFARLDSFHAFAGPAEGLLAGYRIDADPALPDKARIHYRFDAGSGPPAEWDLPYYLPTSGDWLPPVLWLSEGSLATLTYRPDALGDAAGGIFRIAALTKGGEQRLIEDHVGSDTGLLAAAGVLFYTRRSGAGMEVWAAGPDGLRKQRLWRGENTAFAELLDIRGQRRLLLHRQYFGEGSRPALYSELLELSLDPLEPTEGKTAAEVQPLPSAEGRIEDAAPATPPGEREIPLLDSNEGSRPERDDDDLFIPDNPGDSGGGLRPPPIS